MPKPDSQPVTLRRVRCVHPVPFAGPSTLTLDSKDGVLTLDPETGAVLAVPKTPTAISKRIIIPSTNIVFIEPA
jgi:hypothetical protein